MTNAFQEIALLLAAASIGALAIRLRQPLILAYSVVGIRAGTELIFHPYFGAAEYAADKLQHILRKNEAPT